MNFIIKLQLNFIPFLTLLKFAEII